MTPGQGTSNAQMSADGVLAERAARKCEIGQSTFTLGLAYLPDSTAPVIIPAGGRSVLDALGIAGDIIQGATALAGLMIVFIGNAVSGYSSYDKVQQRAVRDAFHQRAWFGFWGVFIAIVAVILAVFLYIGSEVIKKRQRARQATFLIRSITRLYDSGTMSAGPVRPVAGFRVSFRAGADFRLEIPTSAGRHCRHRCNVAWSGLTGDRQAIEHRVESLLPLCTARAARVMKVRRPECDEQPSKPSTW